MVPPNARRTDGSRKGYVYVLVDPAFPSLVKVGKTTKDPERRARDLSTGSGVPAPYVVAWAALVTDCHEVERLIHQELAHARARRDREFFAIAPSKAISIARSIAGRFSTPWKLPGLRWCLRRVGLLALALIVVWRVVAGLPHDELNQPKESHAPPKHGGR